MGSIQSTENEQSAPAFRKGARVAVIGAGVSGIETAAYLLKEGADVTVFERSNVPSGIWHFDSRVTNPPPYPNEKPSSGDYATSRPGQFTGKQPPPPSNGGAPRHPLDSPDTEELQIAFSPPGPCYAGLKNNVPTTLLYSNLKHWPAGTEDFVPHTDIENYLKSLSAENGVHHVTQFNTRVEDAKKSSDGKSWVLRTVTLLHGEGWPRVVERNWTFDAVVVASGHYNTPRIPTIPGLSEWKSHSPSRIIHSKEYRFPETFRGKNILIIGGGTSAMDVARETVDYASRVIQSTRGGAFDLPETMLPDTVERVGGIEKFVITGGKSEEAPDGHIPGHVLLKDGTKLSDIDYIVLATGYITSYPFLPQFHADTTSIDDAGRDILVASDGNMVHNLYKDIFYTEDPTLSFVGVPYYTATFSLFDFQAQAVARILTGKNLLPDLEARRKDFDDRVAAKGRGRKFHSLIDPGAELGYVADLVDSINNAPADPNVEPMLGHSDEWKREHDRLKERLRLLREGATLSK